MKPRAVMKINKLNYEAFMIDYIEGTLSLEDRAMMDLFLSYHPDLKAEINQYLEAPRLVEDVELVFTEKAKYLKRTQHIWSIIAITITILLSALLFWSYINSKKVIPIDGLTPIKTVLPMANNQPIAQQQEWVQEALTTSGKKEKVISEKLSEPPVIELATIDKGKLNRMTEDELMSFSTSSSTIREKPNRVDNRIAPNHIESMLKSAESIILANAAERPLRQYIDEVEPIEILALKDIIPYTPTVQITRLITEPILNIEVPEAIVQQEPKSKKWWNLLVPQSYKDVDLRVVVTSATIKSSIEDTYESALPFQSITR